MNDLKKDILSLIEKYNDSKDESVFIPRESNVPVSGRVYDNSDISMLIESALDFFQKPSGISVFCTQERSQLQNRERAMEILRAKLLELEIAEANAKERSARLSQVGTGDRSEKIRTYNYKDNRTTDHRLGINFPLEQVLAGQLEDVIGACIAEEQKRQMEELSNQSED